MKHKTAQSPNYFLNKSAVNLTLASTFLLSSLLGFSSAFASNGRAAVRESGLLDIQDSSEFIAQAENTLLNFRTANYSVRVFTRDGRTLMNVYDNSENLLRLNAQPASPSVLNGVGVYISNGSYSGRQAQYIVEVLPNDFARLRIVDGSNTVIANQDATQILEFNVPPEVIQRPLQDTILAFETTTYAVRVFERDGFKFMNVFNKFTGETVVNGQPANLVPPEPPFDNAVSYVASGTQAGQSVRFVTRITRNGTTSLEIYNVNNQRLFQELGVGAAVVNIPESDLPAGGPIEGVSDAYVAAVFGDDNTLSEVQQIYPEAFMDSSRQGDFINAGAFPNRDAAQLRVLELRSRGFNARLVFRDVRYR